MAEDLKAALAKALQSAGQKRFYFAYGTGKRKDNTGDGHLIVSIKKPKKADVQAVCACQAYTEGTCWSSADGTALYVAGKPAVDPGMLGKMTSTAKKLAGKAVDFRVPSPEEEQRANALPQAEAAAQKSSVPRSGTSVSDEDATPADAFAARLAGLRERIKAAKVEGGDLFDLNSIFREAEDFAAKEQFDQANERLGRAEARLGPVETAPPS